MSDVFTTLDRREIVWTDRTGKTHLCEGAETHPGVRLLWTRCATGNPSSKPGSLDVPAGSAWLRRTGDMITCTACIDVKLNAEPKELVA